MKHDVPHPQNKTQNYKIERTSIRELKHKTKEKWHNFKQVLTTYIISCIFIYIFNFIWKVLLTEVHSRCNVSYFYVCMFVVHITMPSVTRNIQRLTL
jgi:hypothetical protein